MKENPSYIDTDKPLRVRRGKVDSVDLYEVKEYELEILSNGDTNSIFLNFAIFLLSLSFSSILSISTASFNPPIFQTFFNYCSCWYFRWHSSIISLVERKKINKSYC